MIDFFRFSKLSQRIDWLLVGATIPLVIFGLVTMNSFTADSYYFGRQVSWALFAYALMLAASFIDWRFLRRSWVLVTFYMLGLLTLFGLFVVGSVAKGAQSWLELGNIFIQPVDFIKIVLVLMLAKYFSKRHVEIAHIRHIIVSGLYALVPFILVLIQPDFGSALIIFLIWLGMILVSGVSKKHLLAVGALGVLAGVFAWFFVLQPYQQERIKTFIHPLADIQGSGYNAFQSTIAVGSGEILGKGVGYGTQSRLRFLPEYQTDFIFAAFTEEWGFIGAFIMIFLFAVVIWRVLSAALVGASNFETLFSVGVAVILMAHFVIHVGMNVGLLPVTGLPIPFMSYGGSHLLAEFLALGVVMGMRKYSLAFHRDDVKNEFIGPQ